MASVEGPKYFAEEVGACCAFFWELGALTEFQGLGFRFRGLGLRLGFRV